MTPDSQRDPKPDAGRTKAKAKANDQRTDDGRVPRTPNEHDTSADSQSDRHPQDDALGKAAHKDLVDGKQDTGRSPAMDETYERQK